MSVENANFQLEMLFLRQPTEGEKHEKCEQRTLL